MSSPLEFFLTVADRAPVDDFVTPYDRLHFPTYARLFEGAERDWRQAARVLLGRDAGTDPIGARACWTSHLARARWIMSTGYRQLVEDMRRVR